MTGAGHKSGVFEGDAIVVAPEVVDEAEPFLLNHVTEGRFRRSAREQIFDQACDPLEVMYFDQHFRGWIGRPSFSLVMSRISQSHSAFGGHDFPKVRSTHGEGQEGADRVLGPYGFTWVEWS